MSTSFPIQPFPALNSNLFGLSGRRQLFVFVLFSFLLSLTAGAETLRLVAWTMEADDTSPQSASAAQSHSNWLARNASVLRQLNPDVIVLHNAPDWKGCEELAGALQPAKFSVHVCSAFSKARKSQRHGSQVAILSRQKAYFSWSEDWQGTNQSGAGGFAFAAIQAGTERMGVFVVEVGPEGTWDAMSPEPLQWAKTVGVFKKWATNKLEAAVVAFRTQGRSEPVLVEAALSRPFTRTVTLPASPANCFSATLPADAASLPSLLFSQTPVICDLDIASANPLQAQAVRVESALTPLPGTSSLSIRIVVWCATVAVILGFVALIWAVAILKRRVRRLAAPPTVALLGSGDPEGYADTVVIAPRSATGTSSHSPPSVENDSLRPVVNIESEAAITSTQSQVLRCAESSSGAGPDPLPESVKASVIANLSQWLKAVFVRRMLADREVLLEGQHQAGARAADMDARLARIELQIQQQTQTYEDRIQELTHELNAARQENRALIIAKIDQVKREMEAARSRIVRSEP